MVLCFAQLIRIMLERMDDIDAVFNIPRNQYSIRIDVFFFNIPSESRNYFQEPVQSRTFPHGSQTFQIVCLHSLSLSIGVCLRTAGVRLCALERNRSRNLSSIRLHFCGASSRSMAGYETTRVWNYSANSRKLKV